MQTKLVERAREDDDVAFATLVNLDGDRCHAIAYRILRDVEREWHGGPDPWAGRPCRGCLLRRE